MSDKGRIDFSQRIVPQVHEVRYATPFSAHKDLGRAYNYAFKDVWEDYYDNEHWLCVRDMDTLFLTPDAPNIIQAYVEKYPDTGIFTCYTNRISLASKAQLFNGVIDADDRISGHIKKAELLKNKYLPTLSATEIDTPISGFLMVINCRVWDKLDGFKEGAGCLGIDNDFSQRVLEAGYKILRMNSIYVWHTYRLLTGISNKKHLL